MLDSPIHYIAPVSFPKQMRKLNFTGRVPFLRHTSDGLRREISNVHLGNNTQTIFQASLRLFPACSSRVPQASAYYMKYIQRITLFYFNCMFLKWKQPLSVLPETFKAHSDLNSWVIDRNLPQKQLKLVLNWLTGFCWSPSLVLAD